MIRRKGQGGGGPRRGRELPAGRSEYAVRASLANVPRFAGLDLAGLAILALNRFVDFLAVDRNVLGASIPKRTLSPRMSTMVTTISSPIMMLSSRCLDKTSIVGSFLDPMPIRKRSTSLPCRMDWLSSSSQHAEEWHHRLLEQVSVATLLQDQQR